MEGPLLAVNIFFSKYLLFIYIEGCFFFTNRTLFLLRVRVRDAQVEQKEMFPCLLYA